MPKKKREPLPPVGWREWVSLPELGVRWIKAKVDTGARSSALHAFDLEREWVFGRERIRFKVHPQQRNSKQTIEAWGWLVEERRIKSSNGKVQVRPVIETTIEIAGVAVEAEVTLTSRDAMGFRLLVGRQAVRGRFLVDPGKSYYGDRPRKASPSGGKKLKKKKLKPKPKPKKLAARPKKTTTK